MTRLTSMTAPYRYLCAALILAAFGSYGYGIVLLIHGNQRGGLLWLISFVLLRLAMNMDETK